VSNLKLAGALIESDPDESFRICNERLREHPTDAAALFIVGVLSARAERHSIALPVFERVVKLAPHRHEAWNNLGMSLVECGAPAEAREAFKRAIAGEQRPAYTANLAVTYLNEGNYSECKRWCRKTLEKDPNHAGAWGTLGFASLATGDWETGWKGYEYCLGGRFRKELQFGQEPRWDGSEVESLVIYGEQGIGDEIMYASIVPDAMQRAKSVVIECDARLEGLFRRSFPDCEVHGTRRAEAPWAQGRAFSARSAIASLASHFRPTPESCPQTPYLKADPERRLQWRALFDSWKKPVIGLAWSGGRAATQARERHVGLEAFRGFIERTDAVFVSLEYKDVREEIAKSGLPVRHIPRAVQSPDYDDTAAFVAELDRIIGPPTAVHHLAGALGKPSTILVPNRTMWNTAYGDKRPWYADHVYHRQKAGESWADCIARL
jgi:hypothetical protein